MRFQTFLNAEIKAKGTETKPWVIGEQYKIITNGFFS